MDPMNKLKTFFLDRVPTMPQAISAMGIIELFVFSWSLRGFFYRTPSFILYMDIFQLLAVLAYYMAFALLESSLVFAVLVVFGGLFPVRWIKPAFASGVLGFLIAGSTSSYLLQQQLSDAYPGATYVIVWVGVTFLAGLALAALLMFVPKVKNVATFLGDQISIFAYLYTTIGIISLLTVIIRLLV